MTAHPEIQKAFDTTAKLIFGETLPDGLDAYEGWFTKRIPKGRMKPSVINGKQIYVPEYAAFKFIPDNKVADAKSYMELSKRKVEVGNTETISSLSKKLGPIATFITEFEEGTNNNVHESTIFLNLSNAYRIVDCFTSKNLGYCFFSDNCDHGFGVSNSFNCNFCFNVHDSGNVVRSLDVDFSKNCSDCYFCHDVVNVKNGLFCFNTKNKSYAICNTEVGRERYADLLAKLREWMLKELKAKHRLDVDIYNVGVR
jgi:hypothetical protein